MIVGFEGMPKGLMQVLHERGFIDPANVSKYHMQPDSSLGESEEQPYCLPWLLSRCTDFMEEKTQMTYLMKQLGVEVEMRPKCHPELAGQGTRNRKRWSFLNVTKASLCSDFQILVEKSLEGGPDVEGSDAPLQMTTVLRFARKAHFYKLTYYALR